jgi:hypothetical protein
MQSKGASGQGTTRSESVGRQSAGGSTKSDIRLTAKAQGSGRSRLKKMSPTPR